MVVIPYTQSLSYPLLFTDRVLIHPQLCKLLNTLIKLLIRKSVRVPSLLLDLASCPRYSAVGLRFFHLCERRYRGIEYATDSALMSPLSR